MKRAQLTRLAVLLLWAVASTGCSSLSGYLVDRGRDAADVLTVSVGVGAIGQIRLGPLPVGILDTSDVVGLRYGETFCRAFSGEKAEEHDVLLATIPAAPVTLFGAMVGLGIAATWKSYFERLDNYRMYENNFPLSETQLLRNKGTELLSSPNCYQVEGVIGLGVTLRAGVNTGELLDFILGWSTLDIFKDDIGTGQQHAKPLQLDEKMPTFSTR
jgi:hypothetical protein